MLSTNRCVLLALAILWAPAGSADEGWEGRGAFEVTLASIRTRHEALSEQWRRAGNPAARTRVLARAREFVAASLVGDIFPAWHGTPWHMGRDDDAEMPHQAGKRVSCSMFVTAALQNVGLRLDDRARWAQSRALYIQRSLAPRQRDLHRYFSISPRKLAARLARLDEGLYLIGLNCHVGFIRVHRGKASFIHSNYVDPAQGVTEEPVAKSAAIANSQGTGYWVTPLFHDDRLIRYWLENRPVTLQFLGQK